MPKSTRDPVSGDPFATVTDKLQTALGLFTAGGEIPLRGDFTTTSRASRTTRTTTAGTRTGLLLRAATLTQLAQENLSFFRQNSLGTPEGQKAAERALADVSGFLRKNRRLLETASKQNVSLLTAELAATQKELLALEAAIGAEKAVEAKAAIEGHINLANLRALRLRDLISQTAQIVSFLGRAV
jgi:hypothetical protein